MKHIRLFENFNTGICQIEFTTCIPYNCDDFTGNWSIETHHILVDVESKEEDLRSAKAIFNFGEEEDILHSIQKGKFRIHAESYAIAAIDKFFKKPKKIMDIANECEYLEDFLDWVHDDLYEIVVKYYERSCRGKYDINTEGVRELMKKPTISWI